LNNNDIAALFEQLQFLALCKRFKGEIDLDSIRIENISVEIARQNFTIIGC
jgi:hypothetical protein